MEVPYMCKNQVHQSNPHKPERLPIIRYMIYMLIFTLTVTGTSLSRYASTSSADDVARIAKYSVSATLTTSVTMAYGNYNDVSSHALNSNKNYTFSVTNNSEVSVRARLVVASSDNTVLIGGVATSTSPWYTLAPGGIQNITITVHGTVGGNDVKLRVESEQLD